MGSEIESDLKDNVYWRKKWLIDFNAGETQSLLLDQSNHSGTFNEKKDGPFLEENSSLKCWESLSLLNNLFLSLICSTKFLSPEVSL